MTDTRLEDLHAHRMNCCASEAGAALCAKRIAGEIDHFWQAKFSPQLRKEVVPEWVDWFKDDLAGYKYETGFRKTYERYLFAKWVTRNQNAIVASACRIAIKKVKRECHIGEHHARRLIVDALYPGVIPI